MLLPLLFYFHCHHRHHQNQSLPIRNLSPQDNEKFSWRLSDTPLTRMGNLEVKNHSYYILVLGGYRFGVCVGLVIGVGSGGYRHTQAI